MKKWIALFLVCILCLSFCGCGAQAAQQETEPSEQIAEPTEKFDWDLNANTSNGCAMEDLINE